MPTKNHTSDMPTRLPGRTGILLKSGQAREASGSTYADLSCGWSTTVYSGVVSNYGKQHFGVVTVIGNSALAEGVMVPDASFIGGHKPVRGEVVLVGDLRFGEGPMPRARIAWSVPARENVRRENRRRACRDQRTQDRPAPKPGPARSNNIVRRTGTVVGCGATVAWVQEDESPCKIKAPKEQFLVPQDVCVGRRVSFVPGRFQNERVALAIRGSK